MPVPGKIGSNTAQARISISSLSRPVLNCVTGCTVSDRSTQVTSDGSGDQVEVLLDGGVRRGSDVVKAVALGARAVMIGRADLWGLAANGQAGVENVLDVLRGGIDSAMMGLGRASIHDLDASDVLVPAGFERALGVAPPSGA